MVFVAIFLVFLPIIREPVHSIVAFSIILSGVPVYFIFVHDYEQRPKIFTTINGKFVSIRTKQFFNILSSCFRVYDQIFMSPTEHITGKTISR